MSNRLSTEHGSWAESVFVGNEHFHCDKNSPDGAIYFGAQTIKFRCKKMIVRHMAWLSFALALIGCNWTEREGWDGSGIWSDDGRSALGVYQFYEGQDTPTHVRKRNMESAVYFFPVLKTQPNLESFLPAGLVGQVLCI